MFFPTPSVPLHPLPSRPLPFFRIVVHFEVKNNTFGVIKHTCTRDRIHWKNGEAERRADLRCLSVLLD